MKKKIFNWSCNPTKDRFLNYIKDGIRIHMSESMIEKMTFKRFVRSLKHNLSLVLIMIALLGSNTFFYFQGSFSRDNEVETLLAEIRSIDNELGIKSEMLDGHKYTIDELNDELERIKSSRIYMTAIINKEAGVEVPERVPNNHLKLMFEQADSNNIPYKVFFRVIEKESRFKWWVTSSAGARGYMQVMPATYASIAKKINLPAEMTPESNIIAGAFYLRKKYNEMFDKIIHKKICDKYEIDINRKYESLSKDEKFIYKSEVNMLKADKTFYNNENRYVWELALSAYNAGSSNVGYSVPNIAETQAYVKFILKPYYDEI